MRITRTTVSLAALAGSALVAAAALSAAADPHRVDGDRTAEVRANVIDGPARNVILFIGDGMGDSEITIARNYAKGAAGELAMDALPMTGSYTTYAVQKGTDVPEYVTDSAASGTAWATGVKTYNNAVGVDSYGAPHENIIEAANKNGLFTGNVTTAEIQDATPAVQGAHVALRSCYGPTQTTANCPADAKENGGRGSISEQLLDTRADLTLGGGSTSFNQTATAGEYAGQTLLAQATARGYSVVTDQAGLSGVADLSRPVLGLFAPGNLPTVWTGPKAAQGGVAATCVDNPALLASTPTLPQMTQKSIELLDAASRATSKGFFLQVEGASIDKQDHAANPCAQIGETLQFDESIRIAQDYAAAHPDTLIIVTADHGHTSQIISNGAAATSPGLTATLTTTEGVPMTINYGTAPANGSQEHTGTQVRIAAAGPYAANVLGLTDQTDLNTTIVDALGLQRNLPDDPAPVDPAAALAAAATDLAGLEAQIAALADAGTITLNQKIQLSTRIGLLAKSTQKASDAYAAWVAAPGTSTAIKAKTQLQLASNNAANAASYLASSGIAEPTLSQYASGVAAAQTAIASAQATLG